MDFKVPPKILKLIAEHINQNIPLNKFQNLLSIPLDGRGPDGFVTVSGINIDYWIADSGIHLEFTHSPKKDLFQAILDLPTSKPSEIQEDLIFHMDEWIHDSI